MRELVPPPSLPAPPPTAQLPPPSPAPELPPSPSPVKPAPIFHADVHRHRLRRIALVLAGMVAFYALVLGVAAPPLVRHVAERQLTAALQRQTTIARVVINPFTLTVTVRDLVVRERDGSTFVGCAELRANIQAVSLLRRALVVRELTLLSPTIHLERDSPHHYNVSDLLARLMAPSPEPSRPLRYSIDNIRVLAGSIDFVDRPRDRTHTVRGLLLTLPFISNSSDDTETYVTPALSANIDGVGLTLGAVSKPFVPERETVLDLDFRDLPLDDYVDYAPTPLPVRVPSAALDAALRITFRRALPGRPTVTLSGRLGLRHVVLQHADGRPLADFARLAVEIAPSQPLEGKLTLASVRLERPTLWVRRDGRGRVDLFDALPASTGPTSLVVEAQTLGITDGTVQFIDAPPGGPFATRLRSLTLDARNVSNAPDTAAELTLSLRSDAGEALDARGTVTPKPFAAAAHVAVAHVPLARYAPYWRPLVLADVDAGLVDASGDVTVHGDATEVRGGALDVSGVSARRRGQKQPLVTLAALSLHGIDIDAAARTVRVADAATRDGRLSVLRNADGGFELATLLPPAPPATAPVAASPPWTVAVAKAGVTRWTLLLEDRQPDAEDPVRLQIALRSLTVNGYSSRPGTRVQLALGATINRQGQLTATGSLAPDPLAGTLRLDGKTIDLLPLSPYLADRVSLAITRGALSFGGKLALAHGARGTNARYQGHVLLEHVATVDADYEAPLLEWDSLYLAGIDAATAPLTIAIDEVALTSFHARLAVDEQARINLAGLVPPRGKQAKPSSEPATPVRIGKVTLQDGTIDWADDYVQPRFATRLTEIGGRVSGLSSSAETRADVDLRGKLEGVAPLEITGTINPLARELSLDLAVAFRDIDLAPLSPYAGKYAGYNVARGKLSLDLKYDVQERKLAAQNRIFVDQLTLGQRVHSPKATKLPVKLIVFVLRDHKGEIHLDLPISGSLDDPKFRLGRVVLQALLNLLVKAATEPFAMLGALFGRGPELQYLEFAPGHGDVDAAAADKLRVVTKILQSRPGLKLEITGRVDADRDREGLKRLGFERKVKTQKMKALGKQRVAVTTAVDQLTLAPDEYERYLAQAYAEEKFPKPRGAFGLPKKLPAAEMEKLMLTHVVVDDEELRLLAGRRAEAARQALVKAGIASERVFVIEPKGLIAPAVKGARASRVDFTIR